MSKPMTKSSETAIAVMEGADASKTGLFSLRRSVGRFIWFAVLLIVLFSRELCALMVRVAGNNLHSYILLVPFVSAYLLYTRRCELPRSYSSSPGLAFVGLIGGCAVLAVAVKASSLSSNDHLMLTTLSFVLLLTAGGYFFLGRSWMSAVAFPWFFLFFLVPMPDAMADGLETASQLASTEATSLFFDVTGTPVLRNGAIFQLPNIVIQVSQECSGIRSSWVLMITSLVAANLFLKSPWRRVLLVSFVIPLGIVRNGFRIWTIGTLCIQFGPQMINSIIHRRGGPLFFTLSLMPLFLLLWWLQRGEHGQKSERSNVGIRTAS